MSESDQPDPKEVLQLLQQSTATTQLRDRFEQQPKEYREYLERLNDRTFKYLSILAVAFAIIASIFGVDLMPDLVVAHLFRIAKKAVARVVHDNIDPIHGRERSID